MQRLNSTSEPANLAAGQHLQLSVYRLGIISYDEGRRLQERAVNRCLATGEECLLCCEHPPTLAVGRMSKPEEYSGVDWEQRGVSIRHVDRGGAVTFHGPGQFILYPVIALRRYQFGVRRFVEFVLQSFAETFHAEGIPAEAHFGNSYPVGLWLGGKKLGSVGLRIQQGVTFHGFSVNLECDLLPFDSFRACGYPPGQATSALRWLREEGRTPDFSSSIFADRLAAHLQGRLTEQLQRAQ